MAFSIKTKIVFPVALLTLMMMVLVASAWYALNETTRLNTSLAARFGEIEEVRRIEVLFSELIYPHLDYITIPSVKASEAAHAILQQIELIVDELNEMEVVNQEEREITELITREAAAIKDLSSRILHSDAMHDGHDMYTGLNEGVGTKDDFSGHMGKMMLLNKISEEHIFKIRRLLADWHEGEVRQVEKLAEDTRKRLVTFSDGIIFIAFFMAAVVLFTFWLNNHVLIRPVISLIRSTNQFAAGDLKAEATVFSEDELGALARDINGMASSLDSLYSKLAVMAKTDQLTGLFNRHGFDEIEARESSSAKRYDNPLTLAILDIDHFKKVNDTYGHAVGDAVIRSIADICGEMFRDCDYSFRYGGEEFVVLMPQTTMVDAYIGLERFRQAIEEKKIVAEGHTLGVTVSIGIAQYDKEQAEGQLLKNADLALYEAKTNGRNRVILYPDIQHS